MVSITRILLSSIHGCLLDRRGDRVEDFGSRGEVRWGIELADDDAVQFLSEEEVKALYATGDVEEDSRSNLLRRRAKSPSPEQRQGFI